MVGGRLGVRGKFTLTVGVLVTAVFVVALVALGGLQRIHREAATLTDERLHTVQDSADLVSAAYQLHETALLQLAADTPEMDASVNTELDQTLIPNFEEAVSALGRDYVDQPASLAEVARIRDGLQPYLKLRRAGLGISEAGHGRARLDAADRTELTERIDGIFTDLVGAGERLRAQEAVRAAQTRQEADNTYRSTLTGLGLGALVALILGVAAVAALVRDLIPRIRDYSEFATDVAAGRPVSLLEPRGRDELTELGTALNDLVE